MSKTIFSEKNREHLSTNKYVVKISEKSITYADEFKRLFDRKQELDSLNLR
ncbi:hypothetical protein QFZ77_002826 [Paenibacillus sp. V4I3]|nr:hypothetical protein [Paenibacillus sp. V4I3]MDQ0889956.1 hypothetical protein [Paenibacillus sp. V4I9]